MRHEKEMRCDAFWQVGQVSVLCYTHVACHESAKSNKWAQICVAANIHIWNQNHGDTPKRTGSSDKQEEDGKKQMDQKMKEMEMEQEMEQEQQLLFMSDAEQNFVVCYVAWRPIKREKEIQR